MDVSEHLQRELTYRWNAALLKAPHGIDAETLTAELLRTAREEGPRYHEPDLLGAWAEEAGLDEDELIELIEEALDHILAELDDDEEPWSAHRLIELLEEESFWALSWGLPGEAPPPPPPRPATGTALPLSLRVPLLEILDEVEVTVRASRLHQRSVHDDVPDRLLRGALDRMEDRLHRLARVAEASPSTADDVEVALTRPRPGLPTLREAVATILRWKGAVDFDATPDDDDAEWTLRVIERLYQLSWVIVAPAAP